MAQTIAKVNRTLGPSTITSPTAQRNVFAPRVPDPRPAPQVGVNFRSATQGSSAVAGTRVK